MTTATHTKQSSFFIGPVIVSPCHCDLHLIAQLATKRPRHNHRKPLTTSIMPLKHARQLFSPIRRTLFPTHQKPHPQCLRQLLPTLHRTFSTTLVHHSSTYSQVLRGSRKPQPLRKKTSPQLRDRPSMKGVCLKVGITTPKKPNSGERKTCRVRLSNGKIVTAYIPGEGHNVQQHSVIMVRGGRAQDCPGVRYRCVRGAADLVSLGWGRV